MRQEQFEQRYRAFWGDFEAWLAHRRLSRHLRARTVAPFPDEEFAERFRRVCTHLALARSRGYGPALVDHLHGLAQRGHAELYGYDPGWWRRWVRWLTGGFARDVRRQWPFVLAAAALLGLPYLAMMAAVRLRPEFAWVVLSGDTLASFEHMYGPGADALGRTRDAGSDLAMFGFYISNNIGIGFRSYASGLLAGLGTLVSLVTNGVYMGVAEAHVVNLGYATRFYSFVSGHSSFELTAIALCGAGGLMLGRALLAPGNRTRGAALRAAGRASISIVGGAGLMLLAAAAIEGFWSPRQLDLWLKVTVGILNWALVLGGLALAGRRDAP